MHSGRTMVAWTEEQDEQLQEAIAVHGSAGKWAAIAEKVPGKTGKECRTR